MKIYVEDRRGVRERNIWGERQRDILVEIGIHEERDSEIYEVRYRNIDLGRDCDIYEERYRYI